MNSLFYPTVDAYIPSVPGLRYLGGTLAVMFAFMCCVGITNPNASALAIGPFSKNAGSASALLGFTQMGTGALISTGISAATPEDRLPIVAIFGVTAAIGLGILLVGRKRAAATLATEHPGTVASSEREEVGEALCHSDSAR